MNNHHCPGLVECSDHPRHMVVKEGQSPGYWVYWGPHFRDFRTLPTHAEAITYADREARHG